MIFSLSYISYLFPFPSSSPILFPLICPPSLPFLPFLFLFPLSVPFSLPFLHTCLPPSLHPPPAPPLPICSPLRPFSLPFLPTCPRRLPCYFSSPMLANLPSSPSSIPPVPSPSLPFPCIAYDSENFPQTPGRHTHISRLLKLPWKTPGESCNALFVDA